MSFCGNIYRAFKFYIINPLADQFDKRFNLKDTNKSEQLFSKDAFYGFIKFSAIIAFLVFQLIPVFEWMDSTKVVIIQTVVPMDKQIQMNYGEIEVITAIGRVNYDSGWYDFEHMDDNLGLGNEYMDFLLVQDVQNKQFTEYNPKRRLMTKNCSNQIMLDFTEYLKQDLIESEQWFDTTQQIVDQIISVIVKCYTYNTTLHMNNTQSEMIQFSFQPNQTYYIDTTCQGHGYNNYDPEIPNVCDPSEWDCCGDGQKYAYPPTDFTQINMQQQFRDAIAAENAGTPYHSMPWDTTAYKKGIALFVGYYQQSYAKSGLQNDIEVQVIPFSAQNSLTVDLFWQRNIVYTQDMPIFPMTTATQNIYSFDSKQKIFFGNTAFLVQINLKINQNVQKTTVTVPTVIQVIAPIGGFITALMMVLVFVRNNFAGYDPQQQINKHYQIIMKSKLEEDKFQVSNMIKITPKIDVLKSKESFLYELTPEEKLELAERKLDEQQLNKQKQFRTHLDRYLDNIMSQLTSRQISEYQNIDYIINKLRINQLAWMIILGTDIYPLICHHKPTIVIDDESFKVQLFEKKVNNVNSINLKRPTETPQQCMNDKYFQEVEHAHLKKVNYETVKEEALDDEAQFKKIIRDVANPIIQNKIAEFRNNFNFKFYLRKYLLNQLDDFIKKDTKPVKFDFN